MENFDKKIDLKVMMGFRNEFLCKKCDIFPRPDVKLMRCTSCTGLLCQNCCDIQTKCPLCRRQSKDPKISTFTEESQLMNLLSGFKTHPCVNLKNGCLEEIPANLDSLKAHDQSCILQKVYCPKISCSEKIIFKDLEQHLEQVHTNEVISIISGNEDIECLLQANIYGIYIKEAELVNGRNYYEHQADFVGIWFTDDGYWLIGDSQKKGGKIGFAKVEKDIPFPDTTTNWEWEWAQPSIPALEWAPSWTKANKGLGVNVLSMSTEVWDFEGTVHELVESFCCLNAYNHQFYPQFQYDENNDNFIAFRTVMLGFQEDTIPFQVTVTFYQENDKKITTTEEIVYPITKPVDDTFFETSTNWNLKKLTEYYDTESREIKSQSKIMFRMKIISPKLDEIAKDQHMESGLEDSDMEKEEG